MTKILGLFTEFATRYVIPAMHVEVHERTKLGFKLVLSLLNKEGLLT